MDMRKVSWKQALRWWRGHPVGFRITWVNGKTGRRSFQNGRVWNALLTIVLYKERGIEMKDLKLTFRKGVKTYEVALPSGIQRKGLAVRWDK